MRLYGAATLAWHMRFVASIYPDWDAKYADLRSLRLTPVFGTSRCARRGLPRRLPS